MWHVSPWGGLWDNGHSDVHRSPCPGIAQETDYRIYPGYTGIVALRIPLPAPLFHHFLRKLFCQRVFFCAITVKMGDVLDITCTRTAGRVSVGDIIFHDAGQK